MISTPRAMEFNNYWVATEEICEVDKFAGDEKRLAGDPRPDSVEAVITFARRPSAANYRANVMAHGRAVALCSGP